MQCKKLFLSAIVIFVLFSFSLFSSVGASSVMWSQTYGGEAGEYSRSLVETSDGGYALTGETLPVTGAVDFWLIKTDEFGIIPEFPSWAILPLLLAATLTAIIYRKKLSKTPNQRSYL